MTYPAIIKLLLHPQKEAGFFILKLVVVIYFKEIANAVAKVSGNLNRNQSQETNLNN